VLSEAETLRVKLQDDLAEALSIDHQHCHALIATAGFFLAHALMTKGKMIIIG
jgi:hypothetical protein